MTPHKGETRPRGGADRASGSFRLATEHAENTRPALPLQLAYLGRRIGAIDPATLSTLAAICFGERQ